MATPLLLVRALKSAHAGPFDLELERGTGAAISGPSGSGKSLFLRMIADLDPNEGEVRLNGEERASMPAPLWRGRAAYVAAESGWWADSVIAHFAAYPRAMVAALAERIGLRNGLLHAPVAQLSTGEKQRFALLRALMLEPEVLLLDEPTGALDEESVGLVETLLREKMSAGTAVVLVTHNPSQAIRLGDRRYRMNAGRLSAA